jgi:GNAT superfamily N-acetyltransferase
MTPCLALQDFDTEAFGRPFYRLRIFEPARIEHEIAALNHMQDVVIDAKLPADALAPAAFLQRLGFRKVSTQIEFVRDLAGPVDATGMGSAAPIVPRLDLTPAEISRHAANFVYDRFALDIAIDRPAHDAFFRRWIGNSLSGARHRVAAHPGGFVTFREDEDVWRVDLVSVLDKGKGIGQTLLRAVIDAGRAAGAARLRVITECENAPAVRLYLKLGFAPARFVSAFHFARAIPRDG